MAEVTEQLHAKFNRKEANILLGLLFSIGILTILDVFEDWQDGATLFHIIPEIVMASAAVIVAVSLLSQFAESRREALSEARNELAAAKHLAFEWKVKADELRRGISAAVSKQFQGWGLTDAETEVAFLLLKGLSSQEISKVRNTSEKTIRNQTSEIYNKSGLTGRAQLAAYFIEDLFERV